MDLWPELERSHQWRVDLIASLGEALAAGGSVVLLLVRISATRPGGSEPSLIEQEGLIARAMACAKVAMAIPATFEPLSLHSFGLILTAAPSLTLLDEISLQLRTAVEKHLTLDTAFEVKTTIGLACAPEHARSPVDLLEAADAALGCADAGGRVAVYSHRAQQEASERQERAVRLRHAIEREELSLHYQPQVDPRNGRAGAFEALVRWNLDGKCLAPGDFFDLGGDSFFIELGDWTLRESLRQLVHWRASGFGVQRIAVNLVAQQLRHGDIIGMVHSALRSAKLVPQDLELELVETHIVEHLDRCGEAFEALRASGVRVAIDDFGTGYSSLGYLKALPVDVLKIDRSIAADVVTNPVDSAIVASVCQLARQLQLTTVAEGVEGEDQYLKLASLGCDRLQGYWIAMPEPGAECARWLAARQ
jgi:EAL domain-containing protein (putative c-di-GMP-specific phosphodiesterase class I)